MLKPQANAHREVISLDGTWNFALASSTEPDEEAAWKGKLPSKLQVPVPASYNDIFLESHIRNHMGWVYYQRHATVPKMWAGRRYILRLDAATHRGRVYVNNQFVTEHVGDYMPFEAGLTEVVSPGQKFCLTVAVSNELGWHTIPPGRIETVNGKRKQHYQHDFFNYPGLARSVWLYCVPKEYINDLTVVTDVTNDGKSGSVHFQVGTNQSSKDLQVVVSLLDEDDNVVGRSQGQQGQLAVESVHLCNQGPHISTSCGSNSSTTKAPSQIHTSYPSESDPFKVFINNKSFYFTGFGKHEDTAIRGKGHDAAYMIHDFELMKWTGANSFRTAHYPYAEEVLEYADRHGVVVIDETAAVGLNLSIVAGLHGGRKTPTFSPDTISDATRANHEQAIRELVARDKNHPSVVMWAVANEPAAREYFEPLMALARRLNPTRPLCYANEYQASVDKCLISDLFDAAEQGLEKELLDWEDKFRKHIIRSEYGADTLAGLHTIGDVPWSEEYQSRVLEMSHRVFDRVDSVVGEHVWNFADFQTPSSFIFWVDGNKKGVFTRDRRPKMAAHVLRKRWTEQKPKEHTP
ncbi:beta-glucuronidase [Colletotrichum spaethianum]|uniref:Beta-glucuronidase n=1 Tax=Colletotrichum spaethianum TaxID=700344 RepID=A0AA37URX2_9PEZI|nr:beta-glucuronidase [Colletotrichum spaethianum]GKT51572.1 beta-glucuronidase [Colletotrichum spaethianum]